MATTAGRPVGIVGWRGMVGSVLLSRLRSEGELDVLRPRLFSSSLEGRTAPLSSGENVLDATNMADLEAMETVVSCQGSDYTRKYLPLLRERGWRGLWIDAASALRMEDSSCIALDPINGTSLVKALNSGCRVVCGGNCTTSLLLLALQGLLDKVEWVSTMTYQAASGAGARHMRELLQQMGLIGNAAKDLLSDPVSDILDIDKAVIETMRAPSFPTQEFGVPLAGSVIPWIDTEVEGFPGMSREEWKLMAEANKILERESDPLVMDGLCVRMGSMRCHSQAVTLKLKEPLSASDVEGCLRRGPWVDVVRNVPHDSKAALCPTSVSGTLRIAVGRVREMRMGPQYFSLFTVGDQLLWGAAEPLRRALLLSSGQSHRLRDCL